MRPTRLGMSADTAQTAADGSDAERAEATNDAKKAANDADVLYNIARAVARSNFGLGKTELATAYWVITGDHFLTGLARSL